MFTKHFLQVPTSKAGEAALFETDLSLEIARNFEN